ncbi:MAG TPA: YciI family protein [Aeromicrobium sp.]|nr:YciI family protein [Aeromicrobium sp.]
MKTVVIGTSAGKSMDEIMAVYPRHKVAVDAFIERGEVIGIGPLVGGGNLAIFRTREAAEEFARTDPFLVEGMVASYDVRDWNDDLLA